MPDAIDHRHALYPGTFDPVTKGHQDIIDRAANIFPRVTVAVAASTSKGCMFDHEARIALIADLYADNPGVEVVGYQRELTVHLMRRLGAGALVRGIRANSDFEYELQLANMNRRMDGELETLFLTPRDDCSYISSTLVREIAVMGGDVTPFVAGSVAAALAAKVAERS